MFFAYLRLFVANCCISEEDMLPRGSTNATAESSGSQIPEHATMYSIGNAPRQHAEPRVGWRTMGRPGALRAKTHGSLDTRLAGHRNLAMYTPTQKRAYKRAVHRASNSSHGGTSTWWTERSVQTGSRPAKSTGVPALPASNRRLRAATYNIGGFSTDAYDSFMRWLAQQDDFDIVCVQETHWGLGTEKENSWTAENWRVVEI